MIFEQNTTDEKMFGQASWIAGMLPALILTLMPLASPVLRQEDENLWRYYAAVTRVMRKVVHRVFTLLRPANNQTTKELLLALPNFSIDKYKKLGEAVRNRLDNNHPTEEYDITLLYMLLQKVCGLTDQWSTPGTLENFLKIMKEKRNELAHEDLRFTSQDLESRILSLKNLCRQVLLMTSHRTGCLLDNEIREMEEGMEKALTQGLDMWEPYRLGLIDLKQQKSNIMVREGKKEVRNLSQRFHILNPFAWLLERDFYQHTVSDVFTELTLRSQETVEMKNLLVTELPSGGIPETIIICGPPGIGKTSFMRFILHDWLSGAPKLQGLDAFDLLLLIEARHVMSDNVCQLLRHELLPQTCQYLKDDDIVSTLQELSVLWLLDGYDEASMNTKQVIKEIIRKFSCSKILISTRTECRKEAEMAVSDFHLSHIVFQVVGLSTCNIKACARKLFDLYITKEDEQKENLDSFLGFLHRQNPEMQDIFRVPLFLTMLAVLWIDNASEISKATTSTKLLMVLVDHITKKMITRQSFKRSGLRDRNLKKRIDSFLDDLGYALLNGVLFYTNSESVEWLEERCEGLGLPFEETMSPFFTFVVESSASTTRETYFINHRTIGEFLIARVFCRKMISEDWDVFTTLEEFKRIQYIHLQKQKNPYTPFRDLYERHEPNLTVHNLVDDNEEYYESDDMKNSAYGYERVFSHIDISETQLDASRSYCSRLACLVLMVKVCRCGEFISGYLKIEKEVTPKRAEQIYYIYSLLDTGAEVWLRLITEMEEDEIFLKQITPYLGIFQWNVELRIQADQQLLKYATPQSVLLQSSDEWELSHMQEYVQVFSKIPTDINIHFRDLYYHKEGNTADVLQCLKIIFAECARCYLTTLCCPVDNACVNILKKAYYLQELLVKVNTLQDAKDLAKVTCELPQLQYLEVVFDPVIMSAEPETLPTFNVFQKHRESKVSNCRKQRKSELKQMLNFKLLQFMSYKWKLPTGHCNYFCIQREESSQNCLKCHHSPCSLFDTCNHFDAIKWHCRKIKILKKLHLIINKILLFTRGKDHSKSFNPFVRFYDEDGLWWYLLVLHVTRGLLREHKESIALHNRLLKFTHTFLNKVKTVPIKLVFPESLAFDPVKFGAAVAKLCPNPQSVVIAGATQQLHCFKTSLMIFWIYFSLSNVDEIHLVNFDNDSEDYRIDDIMGIYQIMSKFAPSINYTTTSFGKGTHFT
ncbi:uncharacterized protein [Penaeus vannamei]|uniref:uncharacterized protein n=1 Tax=Penaeus vannamei TaxID=6689 RepID=UPI00387F4F3D